MSHDFSDWAQKEKNRWQFAARQAMDLERFEIKKDYAQIISGYQFKEMFEGVMVGLRKAYRKGFQDGWDADKRNPPDS